MCLTTQSADQEEVLNGVEHAVLSNVLSVFAFLDSFVHPITTLHVDLSSKRVIPGSISQPIVFTRSVRQCCPLSPLLSVPSN